MKPVLFSLKGNPRFKQVFVFAAVGLILFAGIGMNFMIESKVLRSVKEHTAQSDSVSKHQQYQQIVEKTMFLITQSDHNLEDYLQTGTLSKKEGLLKNITAIEQYLKEVKSTYAGYVPKYLVNIFVHKAANRIEMNKNILTVYDTEGQVNALALIDGEEYKSSLKQITLGAQELISALGLEIAQLNKAIGEQTAEMLSLDKKWNIVSLIFMSIIALLVLYKMIETNRLNENLSVAIQKEQQAQLVKDQFISNVTHELRTPLNSIIGYTNLLLKKEHTPENRQWIQSMKISGNLLMEVINDVLDYSKLESGHLQFAKEPLQLNTVMDNLYNVLLNRAESKNLSLVVEMENDVPLHLLGDEKKLMQILVNLTGNSIKFTEEGTVKVQASMLKNGHEKAWISFVVQDTGIGIDEEKLPHVFERFYQVESGTSKKYFGTGLGLPIVKQLVEMQGGEISASSIPGEGTRFEVLLPFAIQQSPLVEAETITTERKQQPLVAKRILIVDDNEMNRDLMGYLLKEHHFQYEKAENGMIALQILQQQSFDFILMDIQMPGISGIETTKRIRAELNLQTPIIGLSAFCQAEEQQAAINSGMNAYLTKPVDEVKLFELLNHYNDWDTQPAQKSNTQLKLVNIEYLQRLTGGKKENIEDLLAKAFDFLPGEIKRLQESFAAEDPAMLKEVAHNMKSTLRILGVAEDIAGKVILIEKGDLLITAEKEQMKHLIDEIDNSVKVVLQELREYLAAA